MRFIVTNLTTKKRMAAFSEFPMALHSINFFMSIDPDGIYGITQREETRV